MDRNQFVIEAEEVERMAKESGLSVQQLLPTLVKSAQKLARPSISKFHVGAVGLGSTGRIFIGVNLEFPGLPLHHSVHAEQFLITNAAINDEPHLQYIAVSAAPCGHCRQFFQEIRNASDIQILITSPENDQNDFTTFRSLSYFLPHPFGPHDLLDKGVPLLLEPHNNGLTFNDDDDDFNGGNDNRCNGNADHESEIDLKHSALRAANKSHAPYSGCPSGVAIMDADGKVYNGSYIESAAHNPSLGPIQTALVAYVAGGGDAYEKILTGVLVEKEGAVVGQEGTAQLLLQSVLPRCDLRVFRCNSSLNFCRKSSS